MSRPPWWRWDVLLASGLGSGLLPKAPGTFGTLAALLPWWWLRELPALSYLAVCAIAFVVGSWISHRLTREPGAEDPGWIVIDEWVGLWLALFLLPAGLMWVLAGFLLFRLFDIAKPWPMPSLERLPGGFGIVADDLMAGIYAAAVVLLAQTF